jgi:hypothetical protein
MAGASVFLFAAAALRRMGAMNAVLPSLIMVGYGLARFRETRPR